MVSAEPADHGCRLWNICSQIYWVRFCYHVFFKCDPVYASCSCAFAGVRGAAVYQHGSVAGKSMAENQKGRTSCLWKAAGNVCFGCYHNINAGGADFRVGLGRNGRLGGRFMDLDRDYHGCSGWTLVLPTFPERKLGASDRGRNWEDNSLYVRYENAILTLYTTKPPEGEQIDIIREKLEL